MRRVSGLLAIALVLSAISASSPAASSKVGVDVWLTKPDQSQVLAKQPGVAFGADSTSGLLLNVNENHAYQRMDGFGAALTDSAAWLIANKLSASQLASLMNSLFSSSGIGISYLRVPMGASDFVAGGSHYTYDDMPPGQIDPGLASFSIAHDNAYIVPLLRQARSLNPALKVMASPWSAPAWMKSSNSLIGGTLLPAYYGSFAEYVVRFIQAYQSAGIPVDAITIQNEPQYLPSDYPGMWLTARDEANLVENELAPALAAGKLATKIIGLDHNWGFFPFANELLSDATARASIAGVAFHCYGGRPDHMSRIHDAFPTVGIYFDECTTTGPTTNWAGDFAWDMENLIIGSTRNWSSTVVKWNLALDTSYGPHLGGCGSCKGLVTIGPSDGAVGYNLDFYSMGHISKFVLPGAHRIASSDLGVNRLHNVAFRNPDGSKVLIVFNGASRSQTFKVRWGGTSFQYSLAGGAAATFTWAGTQATPGPPTAPADLSATASDGKVTLNWLFSPLADSYRVRRSTTSTGPFTTIADHVSLPSFTDTTVANGTAYSYQVTAVNSAGESPPSAVAGTTPNPPAPLSAGSQIEAESFDAELGVALERCVDTGGGEDVGYAEDGNYLGWNAIDFGSRGYTSVSVRVASGSAGGTLELRLGSPTGARIASVPVSNTGGWQTWSTIKSALSSSITGVQSVYVSYKGQSPYTGIANLNWIKFTTR